MFWIQRSAAADPEKCGVHYFMTTKISWNEVNKIPYDTFYWKGIDGTKVLSHFIPTRDYVSKTRSLKTNNEHTSAITTNYNGYLNPCQIKGAWQRYQQKELNNQVLCSFGYGDGGGGPTAEMLETQRRLAYGIPGCPTTKPATAREFLTSLLRMLRKKTYLYGQANCIWNIIARPTPAWRATSAATAEVNLRF